MSPKETECEVCGGPIIPREDGYYCPNCSKIYREDEDD